MGHTTTHFSTQAWTTHRPQLFPLLVISFRFSDRRAGRLEPRRSARDSFSPRSRRRLSGLATTGGGRLPPCCSFENAFDMSSFPSHSLRFPWNSSTSLLGGKKSTFLAANLNAGGRQFDIERTATHASLRLVRPFTRWRALTVETIGNNDATSVVQRPWCDSFRRPRCFLFFEIFFIPS
ncbi:hypothetical protein TGVAND_218195 [Toxoplasma gondii VAND]|uniref:Uncharacterized protein n=1 Tax=Toxoplasma gondii VAND TaxID=933077 RepID=A0A086PY19_TOXGO|nr:hypothetical protein TGVAND_218195 [Toxoplasma gondii VAND]